MEYLWKMFTCRLGIPLAYHPQGSGESKLVAVDIVSKTATMVMFLFSGKFIIGVR
jgi:hypothetical protein